MNSSDLLKRAEHALLTGQTENLFPVLARRALEVIAEENQAARRDVKRAHARIAGMEQARWYLEHPDVFDQVLHAYAEAARPAFEALQTFWDQMREAMKPAIELVLELAKDMPHRDDYALVPMRPQGYAPLGQPGPAIPHYAALYGDYQPNGHTSR